MIENKILSLEILVILELLPLQKIFKKSQQKTNYERENVNINPTCNVCAVYQIESRQPEKPIKINKIWIALKTPLKLH